MRITYEMSQGAYSIAKQAWEGTLTRYDAKHIISKTTGMALGSAQAFITIFLSMMEGKVYKRAFNNATNKLLFEMIRKDYGDEYMVNALNAASKHVEYYSTLNKGNLTGLTEIIQSYR